MNHGIGDLGTIYRFGQGYFQRLLAAMIRSHMVLGDQNPTSHLMFSITEPQLSHRATNWTVFLFVFGPHLAVCRSYSCLLTLCAQRSLLMVSENHTGCQETYLPSTGEQRYVVLFLYPIEYLVSIPNAEPDHI